MRFGEDMMAPPMVDAAPPPEAPPQGYLWPDGLYYTVPPPQQQAPQSPYAQPQFWVDLFGNATMRALQASQPQPVVVVQQPPSILPWLIGGAVVVVVIRALR